MLTPRLLPAPVRFPADQASDDVLKKIYAARRRKFYRGTSPDFMATDTTFITEAEFMEDVKAGVLSIWEHEVKRAGG